MKYLGIDYGTKRIGVAVSDDGGKLAFPLKVVATGPAALSELALLAKEKAVGGIVIGESRDFKDRPNAVMKDIELMKRDLAELTGLPVEYELEFMTSVQAERQGKDKRGEGAKASDLDASAAALILQSYLDRRKTVE